MTFDAHPTASEAGAEKTATTAPTRRPRRPLLLVGGILALVIVILLTLLLHAVLQPTHPATASATATPVPKVVYQTDFSQGVSGWTLPPHWTYASGQVQNDGYGAAPLTIPYDMTQQNYTVSVDFTVAKIPNYLACHTYGIEGFDTGGNLQWAGQISCIRQGVANAGFSEALVAHADTTRDSLTTEDYTVSHDTLTFTVQVRDKNLAFCPGPSCLPNVNSTAPLWPVHLVIEDVGVQLTVSKVIVTIP